MTDIRKTSGNSMGWSFLQACLTLAVLGGGYMAALDDVAKTLATDAGGAMTALARLQQLGLPVSAGVLLVIALVTGAGAGRSARRALEEAVAAVSGKKKTARAPKEDPAVREAENRRLYLHLLTTLQREGRLVDFFSENLDAYDDAQIGAAVRSIQSGCKTAVDKYLAPDPILEAAEGDTITVESGFSPARINLTGNVSGTPPFSGVVRHRGWQAGKIEIPKLSGDPADAAVISPAEVEVL